MTIPRKYILVDDDPFNNIICKMQLERALGNVDIKIFEVPEEGLQFIQNESAYSPVPTILLLDLNMPSLTGWQFIEEFEKMGEQITTHTEIYILSSSVDPRDKGKANANKFIKGFLSKPLNRETILSISGV